MGACKRRKSSALNLLVRCLYVQCRRAIKLAGTAGKEEQCTQKKHKKNRNGRAKRGEAQRLKAPQAQVVRAAEVGAVRMTEERAAEVWSMPDNGGTGRWGAWRTVAVSRGCCARRGSLEGDLGKEVSSAGTLGERERTARLTAAASWRFPALQLPGLATCSAGPATPAPIGCAPAH